MIKLLLKLLKSKKINSEERSLILIFLLEKVNTLPIKDILTYELDGTIKVNDKNLSLEQAISLRESAVALQANQCYRLIKEQIAYEAIKIGIHMGNTLEQIIFPKAALWIQAQEIELIAKLSGQIDKEDL